MKRTILTLMIILSLFLTSRTASAQENRAVDMKWADGWKFAFSKEGVKEWKPEFTLRAAAGFYTTSYKLTGGVRIDEKRSFSLFAAQGNTYRDHAPGSLETIRAGLNFRRYWHLGKRKIFAIYSDLYTGGAWIYKVDGKYHYYSETGERTEVIEEDAGDAFFIVGWQPGIRIRCYRNLHLFLGPTLATDCLGLHLGIGF